LVNFYQSLAKNSAGSLHYAAVDGMGQTNEIKAKIFALIEQQQG